MNPALLLALALVLAFLSGSLPFGLWIARFRGVDIKTTGSGNIGFTNVWRSVGRVEGVATLALDIAKGALPTWALPGLLVALGPAYDADAATGLAPATAALFFGLAAILGHCFTPFAGFRGGKGVATSLGVFLVLAPVPILICLGVFAALVAATRYISLGSVTCAILLPVLVYWREGATPLFWVAGTIGAMVVALHHGNIRRLLAGTERKFGAGKPPDQHP